MPVLQLTEDEFRILAYIRAYADGPEQHLDPNWVMEQLVFSLARFQKAARGLDEKGLATLFEFEPNAELLAEYPGTEPGPQACDIILTEQGWHYLWQNPERRD